MRLAGVVGVALTLGTWGLLVYVGLSTAGEGDGFESGRAGAFVLAMGATLFILPASIAALTWSPETDRAGRLGRWVLRVACAVNGLIAVAFLALAVRSAGNEPSSITFWLSLAVIFILIAAAFGWWASRRSGAQGAQP